MFFAEDPPAQVNPILPIWQEIVVGALAFGLLCFVLMKYVFPRMEQTFRARVEAIEGGLRRAEERQAEANRLFERYQKQLDDARAEAAQIRERAIADAERISQEKQLQARDEHDRIIAAGWAKMEAQRQAIVRELRADMGRLAVDLASRIVGEALADEARRRRTVERFLAELDRIPAAGPAASQGSEAGWASEAGWGSGTETGNGSGRGNGAPPSGPTSREGGA